MAERTISATEARVHFGEVLDSVVQNLDIVYVQRGGRLAAVILSIEEWKRHQQQKRDPWEGFMEEMEEHWAYLAEARKAGRLKDFDAAEVIRAGREERDEQLLGDLLGR
ncbi:MAG TPA: type II toxin-antitoxin system Phd/YefM family antitoxin [Actinophytocola sp.]|uniref:type II toxin-antitoxin system Phd/YefM family antitoxin n=1 Tax=Actinophytocola sp. TaxID=1872138 RepID=UPI002DDD749E|nr:type II toxin-antitoxin system Phd/YefM family antitoxin [Actinophytocola sp.]HEV2780110.1 type II toxin-antitoxin system Phd/YefM family antitoxin [Actinophytocola sp.]